METTSSKLIPSYSQGNKTYYDRQGRKNTNDICVYLLHGLGGDSSAWKDIRLMLAKKGYGSVAIDLRGHGWSSRPADLSEYALQNMAEDVIEIIKHEKDRQIVLIGHCLGGMVVIKVASLYSRLQGIVLINTYYKHPEYASFLVKMPYLTKTFYVLGKIFTTRHISERPNYDSFRGSADISLKRIISDVRHTSLRSYCFLVYQVLQVNLKQLLGKITMPVLALIGVDDSIFRPKNQYDMAANFPQVITQDIKKGNHVMVFDKEKEIADAIDTFIKNLGRKN